VTDWEWNPDTYLQTMAEEIPGYAELQDAVVEATRRVDVHDALELGVGTGESALRVLAAHPGAHWTGIDASEAMLARARERLPHADLQVARLEDPLPAGPFDLVVSALAVHHLDAAGKRDLFARVASVLHEGGAFVLGDLVVPEREEDAVIFVDWEMDVPDRVDAQVEWLRQAGLEPELVWKLRDLAVIRAGKAKRPPRRG
jgi:tRNA (cmo5U34)-methyltransferase